MLYTCKASNCSRKSASKFGHYCYSHRSRKRRHGAVDQLAITKADLKRYETVLENRIARNKDKAIWSLLVARWEALVSESQRMLRETASKPTAAWKKTAAGEIVSLWGIVHPEAIIRTVLAMFLMQDQEPRRFSSDKAFNTQIVRRVRGLSPLNARRWADPTTGRTKTAYTELSPKAVEAIAAKLVAAFGATGVTIAQLERRQYERERQEQAAYHEAMGEIQ